MQWHGYLVVAVLVVAAWVFMKNVRKVSDATAIVRLAHTMIKELKDHPQDSLPPARYMKNGRGWVFELTVTQRTREGVELKMWLDPLYQDEVTARLRESREVVKVQRIDSQNFAVSV